MQPSPFGFQFVVKFVDAPNTAEEEASTVRRSPDPRAMVKDDDFKTEKVLNYRTVKNMPRIKWERDFAKLCPLQPPLTSA